MSVYLDTSDIEQIKTLSDLLPIAAGRPHEWLEFSH